MPRSAASFPGPRPARLALRLAMAGSVAAMLAATVGATLAQEWLGLRGTLGDARENTDGAKAAASAAIDSVTTGALSRADDAGDPDGDAADAADDGLFGDTASGGVDDNTFSAAPRATARAPSTRKARVDAAKAQNPPAALAANRGMTAAAVPGAADAEADNPRAPREAAATALDAPALGRTLRAPPVEDPSRAAAAEENPYAPLGFRVGTFILRPSLETGLTASSNASRTPGGSSGTLSETTLRLDGQSDWSENSATVNGFGTFRRSLTGDDRVEEVEAGVDARLLVDLGHDWQAHGGLSYAAQPELEAAGSGNDDQQQRQTLEAEGGLDKALGLLRLGSTVSVERDSYGRADLSDGASDDDRERDSTLALVKLRAGYELSPALIPFVEVEGGRRFYDRDGDAARLGARAGVALDLREKLSGEVSAGYLREGFDGDEPPSIEGFTVNANLDWSPVRGTVVGLTANTTVEGAGNAGDDGSLIYNTRLDIERTLRANLTANAALGASLRDYAGSDGRDLTLVAELGATWWLNRNLGLSGRLRHERLDSNLEGRDYRENSVVLGTKLQY